MRNLFTLVAVLATGIASPGVAVAKHDTGCNSKKCIHRVEKKQKRHREYREMKRYRARPMPRCTWWNESGVGKPEWSQTRYRVWNDGSSNGTLVVPPAGSRGRASGKFQIIRSTWIAMGGKRYADAAALATGVEQERVARRVLAYGGLNQWEGC